MIQDKIKELHASEHYGIIAEAGCGVPVAGLLLAVEGASSTIYSTLSPYSREAQTEMFGQSDARAVSLPSVRKDISRLVEVYGNRVNFVYYSSFQLTGAKEDAKTTHGWIGVAKKDKQGKWSTCIVHTSHHLHGKTRPDLISAIGNECALFLINFLFDEGLPSFSGIDNMYRGTITLDEVGSATYAAINQTDEDIKEVLENIGTNNYVCITPTGVVRVEELFRERTEIALYKGSFRPITNAHVELVSDYHQARQQHNSGDVVFMISVDTFDKGSQEMESVMWRINLINKLGYTAIVTLDGYFATNAMFFRRKFGKPINFLVGSDTINRVVRVSIEEYAKRHRVMVKGENEWELDRDANFEGCTFWVAMRPNIPLHVSAVGTRLHVIGELSDASATMVREMRHRGDVDGIRALLPAAIVDDYLKTREEI